MKHIQIRNSDMAWHIAANAARQSKRDTLTTNIGSRL